MGDVGERPVWECLAQTPGNLRRDEVELGAQDATGEAQLGKDVGDGGKALHRLDAVDGGLLAGVFEAAPHKEDGGVGRDEECRRAGRVGIVEDVAVVEEERGVDVGGG